MDPSIEDRFGTAEIKIILNFQMEIDLLFIFKNHNYLDSLAAWQLGSLAAGQLGSLAAMQLSS